MPLAREVVADGWETAWKGYRSTLPVTRLLERSPSEYRLAVDGAERELAFGLRGRVWWWREIAGSGSAPSRTLEFLMSFFRGKPKTGLVRFPV